MRLAANLTMFSAFTLAATGPAAGFGDVSNLVVQGGALAILGWMVWYLMSRTFPAHTKALHQQRTDFLDALRAEREESKKSLESAMQYVSVDCPARAWIAEQSAEK